MTFTLASLEKGQSAVITGFAPECRQEVRQRLLDLGFVRGSSISVENVSPLADPVAYNIHNTQIALRKSDALCVLINLEENEKCM
ncbi:FeoA family protein [Capnocytophaga leadbetteri]|uniref:FeoA family protein n=1 Tax=Capnocytophaga leadbetteri TaxID=327575 RepID=UPI0028ED6E93|nr:FeoA family protein [Capnocytophaga leadbetteri]